MAVVALGRADRVVGAGNGDDVTGTVECWGLDEAAVVAVAVGPWLAGDDVQAAAEIRMTPTPSNQVDRMTGFLRTR